MYPPLKPPVNHCSPPPNKPDYQFDITDVEVCHPHGNQLAEMTMSEYGAVKPFDEE
jgi:hypothetical protein